MTIVQTEKGKRKMKLIDEDDLREKIKERHICPIEWKNKMFFRENLKMDFVQVENGERKDG